MAKRFVNDFYVSCTKCNKSRRTLVQLLRQKDRLDLRDNVYEAILSRDTPEVCGVLLRHQVVATLSELRDWLRCPEQHDSHVLLLEEVRQMLPFGRVALMDADDFKGWLLTCKRLVEEDEQLEAFERFELLRDLHTCYNVFACRAEE